MAEAMAPRGPDAAGVWSQGRVALGHRRLKIIDLSEAGAQPMVDSELGLAVVLQRLHLQLQGAAPRADRATATGSSRTATPRCCSRPTTAGATASSTACYGMFAFAIVERDSGRVLLGRDRLGIKPLYLDRGRAPAAVRLVAAGAAGRRRRRHPHRPGRAAPLPDLPLGRARRRARSCAASRKLPPATAASRSSRTAAAPTTTYWAPDFTRRAERAGLVRTRLGGRGSGVAAASPSSAGMVADVPVGVPAVRRRRLQPDRRAARRGGPDTGWRRSRIGFESVGGVEGDEFKYSDIVAERFGTDHHQIRIGTDRMLPALDGAIGAMSEPMVSHDCVAFYLLSQEVAKHVKVVQSGQGADEVFAGYHWYPPLGEPDAASRRRLGGQPTAQAFFDRDAAGVARARRHRSVRRRRTTRAGAVRRRALRPRGRRRPASTARCGSTPTVMLVDDPVKRVDNMTMAWGLEARVPFLDHELVELAATCPPELKTRARRQGRAQGGGAPGHPGRGHRPPQGLLPGARAHPPRRAGTSTWSATRCTRRPPRSAACSGPKRVDALLADPNGQLTPLRGNELWQLALLELWLQRHGIDRSRGMTTEPVRPATHRRSPQPPSQLGLHDASPPSTRSTRMADDVVLELGWGRLIFGQTFADAGQLAEVLRGEEPRPARHLHLRPRVRTCSSPWRPTSCSSTRATPTGCASPTTTSRAPPPIRASRSAPLTRAPRRRRDEPRLRALRNGVPRRSTSSGTTTARDAVTYLVAVRDDDGTIVGTVTGVDHELLFADPEDGSSLWTPGRRPHVEPARRRRCAHPRARRATSAARGRAYMDLSVAHDNAAAIALYEKLGFQRVPVLAVKRKNAINEPLFTHAAGDGRRPQPVRADHRRRSDAPRDLGGGARRRGR